MDLNDPVSSLIIWWRRSFNLGAWTKQRWTDRSVWKLLLDEASSMCHRELNDISLNEIFASFRFDIIWLSRYILRRPANICVPLTLDNWTIQPHLSSRHINTPATAAKIYSRWRNGAWVENKVRNSCLPFRKKKQKNYLITDELDYYDKIKICQYATASTI